MGTVAKQQAVWFRDHALHARLKARCASEGRSMSWVIEGLVTEYLDGVPAPRDAPPSKALDTLEAQMQAMMKPDRQASRRAKIAGLIQKLDTVTEERAEQKVRMGVCQRPTCGHPQSAHQKSGCLGTCTCSIGRYRA